MSTADSLAAGCSTWVLFGSWLATNESASRHEELQYEELELEQWLLKMDMSGLEVDGLLDLRP